MRISLSTIDAITKRYEQWRRPMLTIVDDCEAVTLRDCVFKSDYGLGQGSVVSIRSCRSRVRPAP